MSRPLSGAPKARAARLSRSSGPVSVRPCPELVAYVPPCPIHALTGIDCPGCGMTRGTMSLLSGDVAGAIGPNALMFVLGLPLLALLWFFWLRDRVGGRPAPDWARSRAALYAWLALTVVFTVVRNLPWAPFTVLAA